MRLFILHVGKEIIQLIRNIDNDKNVYILHIQEFCLKLDSDG